MYPGFVESAHFLELRGKTAQAKQDGHDDEHYRHEDEDENEGEEEEGEEEQEADEEEE